MVVLSIGARVVSQWCRVHVQFFGDVSRSFPHSRNRDEPDEKDLGSEGDRSGGHSDKVVVDRLARAKSAIKRHSHCDAFDCALMAVEPRTCLQISDTVNRPDVPKTGAVARE